LWFFGRYIDQDWYRIINSVEDLHIVKSDTILKDSVNIFIIKNNKNKSIDNI
jgi:hypothetical protein